jgi:hypothetical protein
MQQLGLAYTNRVWHAPVRFAMHRLEWQTPVGFVMCYMVLIRTAGFGMELLDLACTSLYWHVSVGFGMLVSWHALIGSGWYVHVAFGMQQLGPA